MGIQDMDVAALHPDDAYELSATIEALTDHLVMTHMAQMEAQHHVAQV